MNQLNTTNSQPAIALVENVSKFFGKLKALDSISLEINKGEVLSILGPNGAGKTTLINLMLGRLKLSSGAISIFGLEPGKIELKRKCGAMLQVASLPDMSTVKEHIQLFQSYYANPMAYQKVIAYAGLEKLENNYSKNLSGGQKQRLLFALSICGNPKLLFLDEPTVGLDVNARKSLWQAILDLKQQGASIVLTTHYLEEADYLSDRIIMLNQGQVIQCGTPEQIKSQVNSKIIRFSSTATVQQLMQLKTIHKVEFIDGYYQIKSKNSEVIIKEIVKSDIDISDLTVTGAALEDAFIALNQQQDSFK